MMKTLGVPQGTKLRKAVLATAGAVAILAVSGTIANAADFYFYGDNQTDFLNSTNGLANFNNYKSTTAGCSSGCYDDTIGKWKDYYDAGGTGKKITAKAFNNKGYGYTSYQQSLVENTRAVDDLGLGVKSSNSHYADSSQPLELAMKEVIRIDLGGSYQMFTDVIAYFSSIDGLEEMQVATSNNGDPDILDWSPSSLPGGTPNDGGVPTYDIAYNSSAGEGTGAGVNLSNLFGSDLSQYIFFREDKWRGGTNDDVLLMQLSYQMPGGGTPGIPEPGTLAIFGFGVIGMAAARRRKRTGMAN